jgi:hypothetical protein
VLGQCVLELLQLKAEALVAARRRQVCCSQVLAMCFCLTSNQTNTQTNYQTNKQTNNNNNNNHQQRHKQSSETDAWPSSAMSDDSIAPPPLESESGVPSIDDFKVLKKISAGGRLPFSLSLSLSLSLIYLLIILFSVWKCVFGFEKSDRRFVCDQKDDERGFGQSFCVFEKNNNHSLISHISFCVGV